MNLMNKIINKETILYSFFGVLTTILNIGLYQVLVYYRIDYTDANLIALVATKIAAYIVNKLFVFNSKTNNLLELLKEIGRFIISRGATMLLDYFGLILMVEYFGLNKSISKYLITFIVIIVNYFLGKRHVFVIKGKDSVANGDICNIEIKEVISNDFTCDNEVDSNQFYMKKYNKRFSIELIIILTAFIFYFIWSITLPYNTGPDEYMRYDIPKFIFENGYLPHGGDPRIRNELWGFSYGFVPLLSSIISAGFMKIVSFFHQGEFALLTAARFVSVLFSTGTVFMCIKIGDKLYKDNYKYLFAVLVGFLPQFVFISSYINNDSIAVFSTSIIIYNWIIGLDSKWDIKSIIGLALGISLCGLSYYNAYGYVLCSILLFIISLIFMYKSDRNKMYKDIISKGLIISVIVLLLIGWWFIRSYIIYDGDILGLNTVQKYSEMYAVDRLKPSNRNTIKSQGLPISYMIFDLTWFISTAKSFIGVFDYMSLPIYKWMYIIYLIIFIAGIAGSIFYFYKLFKNKKYTCKYILLNIGFITASIITVFISIYNSYAKDYQPQGRYIMPVIIPLMYYITIGIRYLCQKNIKNKPVKMKRFYYLLIGYIVLSFIIYYEIILKTYVFSY